MHTLEIYVTQINQAQQSYYVKLELANGSIFNGRMSLANLPPPPANYQAESIVDYGLLLFERLLPGRLANGFHQAWGQAQNEEQKLRLFLWFDSNDPQLHAVPWELMHYDVGGQRKNPIALATSDHVTFSRFLSSSDPWSKPVEHRPLSLLAAISNPSDLGEEKAWKNLLPIDADEYRTDLTHRFQTLKTVGQISYEFLPDNTMQTSAENLHKVLEKDYDILIYFGHALNHPDLGTYLLLVDDNAPHGGKLYDGDELVRRMRESRELRPNLIILIACNTAATTTITPDAPPPTTPDNSPPHVKDTLTSLAAQLVQEGGVPAVLAMQRLININHARTFTYQLCEQLIRHGVIDVAVNTARRSLYQSDDVAWSTPTLYMRMRDGRLFSPNPRQEYAQAILNDTAFSRWIGDDSSFINLEAIAIPAGQDWNILEEHPEDAPLARDTIQALHEAITQKPSSKEGYQKGDHDPLSTKKIHNITTLIGPPHKGQSVILKCFIAQLAQESLCQLPTVESDSMPEFIQKPTGIYVKLAGYEDQPSSERRIEHLIVDTTSAINHAMAQDLATLFNTLRATTEEHESSASYVFLLDGLDKISDHQRIHAAREIMQLAALMPEHHFIISCNQHVLPTVLSLRCLVLLLLPINERIVLRYLQRRNPTQSHELFRRIVENQLIELTTDPIMFTHVYRRITEKKARLTRNDLILDYLNEALSGIPSPYIHDNAARKILTTLAWKSRWELKETLTLDEVFATMAKIRQNRDYDLEELYQIFQNENLLMPVGQHQVRFVHPILHAYCAALELLAMKAWRERFQDILVMCGVSNLLEWWEETIYAFVGLHEKPIVLLEMFSEAAHNWGGPHRLLAARSLSCISHETIELIPLYLLQKLIDACLIGLDTREEPSMERRETIVTALGRLSYPITSQRSEQQKRSRLLNTIQHTLVRILTQRVRWTPNGPRYDYTMVRIAAARALRTRHAMLRELICPYFSPQISTTESEEELTPEELYTLLNAWSNTQRAHLRSILKDSQRKLPERAIAAFALGDIAYYQDDEDANALIDIIMLPETDSTEEDIIWAATDALTLFDAQQTSRLLTELFNSKRVLPQRSTEQLAYIVGRVRTHDEAVIIWIIKLFMLNPDLGIKAKALQSMAWIGETRQSNDWLIKAIQSDDIEQTFEFFYLDIAHQVRPLLQNIVINLVSWEIGDLLDLGFIKQVGPFSPEEARDYEQNVIYLRRKAIEAIAWIGDSMMLQELCDYVPSWTMELRLVWYAISTLINEENGVNVIRSQQRNMLSQPFGV